MFIFRDNQLEILPEILSIKCMKKLWDRDKTEDHEMARNQFYYMYHTYNRHSDFSGAREDIKKQDIIFFVFGCKEEDLNWKPEKDMIFQECVETYKKILSYSPKHYALESFKEGLYIIGDKMKSDGNKISDITKEMQNLDRAYDSYDSLKAKADRDELDQGISKIKGNLRLGKRQI